jgi:hypothetical protein
MAAFAKTKRTPFPVDISGTSLSSDTDVEKIQEYEVESCLICSIILFGEEGYAAVTRRGIRTEFAKNSSQSQEKAKSFFFSFCLHKTKIVLQNSERKAKSRSILWLTMKLCILLSVAAAPLISAFVPIAPPRCVPAIRTEALHHFYAANPKETIEPRETKYCIPLDELCLNDLPKVGGKTASLGEMIQELAPLGVEVPGGFGVTSYAYDAVLEQHHLRERLQELLKDIDGKPWQRSVRLLGPIDNLTLLDPLLYSNKP